MESNTKTLLKKAIVNTVTLGLIEMGRDEKGIKVSLDFARGPLPDHFYWDEDCDYEGDITLTPSHPKTFFVNIKLKSKMFSYEINIDASTEFIHHNGSFQGLINNSDNIFVITPLKEGRYVVNIFQKDAQIFKHIYDELLVPKKWMNGFNDPSPIYPPQFETINEAFTQTKLYEIQ